MPQKRKHQVHIAQLTAGGKYTYPWIAESRGEAEFSPSYSTCRYNGLVLIRDRGSMYGGNYVDQATGDAYRVTQSKANHSFKPTSKPPLRSGAAAPEPWR